MPISSYNQYRNLNRVDQLEAGDLLLKKVFPETCKGAVEWGITTGEKLFSGDTYTAGIFSSARFRITFNGSHTSEHAALAISSDELAEAVGEGVITASIRGRRDERYCVYRCTNHDLRDAAVMIAKGLSNAYHHVVTGNPGIRNTTGGAYSIGGAIASNFRGKTFQPGSTNDYLTHIIDYVFGLRHDRPNMFCSEFAVACYEAGSVALSGKTAFGANPGGMSPMVMEDVLNGRPDLMRLVGKFDSENDALFFAVERGLRSYSERWHFNRSRQSKNAEVVLHNLMQIGDNDYLLAAVAAFLNARPARPLGLSCNIPPNSRLKTDSSLYRDLKMALQSTGLLTFNV